MDVQVPAAVAPATNPPATVSARRRWADHLFVADPGLNRLRTALLAVATIGVALWAESLFVNLTGALQLPTTGLTGKPAAEAALANHELLVIAMLLGALACMMSAMGVVDLTPRGQLLSIAFIPLAMVPALVLGIWLSDHRVVCLVLLAVVLAAGAYLRRFGPRGMLTGLVLFMGFFFGFFLGPDVKIGDVGWLIAEVAVGTVVAVVVRFVFFFPRPRRALIRTQRSYASRARKVAALSLAVFDDPADDHHQVRRLYRQLLQLNEAALMIDAQLADPAAVADGSSAQLLHQRLFDVELALTNVARFAEALTHADLTHGQRSAIRGSLAAIVNRDADGARAHAAALDAVEPAEPADRTATVVVHRFAGSVTTVADAMTEWLSLGRAETEQAAFQPSVTLFGGWLPGSAMVSATASREPGQGLHDRVRLAPYTRVAIQMGVAVGLAIVLGDLLSGRRFYWAVIAAFITFMGVNNSAEQARKGFLRIVGTVVGIGIGSLLVDAVGHQPYWSIAVVLVSLFFGFYLMRVNYAFMVVGITVMVSQLYVQLDEFSNSLLLLRLEETAIGAAVAILVVLLVLPLRTRQVLGVALRQHVDALQQLVADAGRQLAGDGRLGPSLRADARAVDASYQTVVATARPLQRNLVGRADLSVASAAQVAAATRNYARNLAVDAIRAAPLDADARRDVKRATDVLHASMDALTQALVARTDGAYVRAAALLDEAERRCEARSPGHPGAGRLALRDLQLIDGALARLAQGCGLPIGDYDTVGLASPAKGSTTAPMP